MALDWRLSTVAACCPALWPLCHAAGQRSGQCGKWSGCCLADKPSQNRASSAELCTGAHLGRASRKVRCALAAKFAAKTVQPVRFGRAKRKQSSTALAQRVPLVAKKAQKL